MPAVKYQQYYQQAKEQHAALFADFAKINESRSIASLPKEEFDRVGQQVVDILRDTDRRLCSQMGKGQYSVYTQKLSDKFWAHVRQEFKYIDLVGLK